MNDTEQLINLNDGPVQDSLFYLEQLYCPICEEFAEFTISNSNALCNGCSEQLNPTQDEIDLVEQNVKESPRTAVLRFKTN